jgi:hypothetical protein
MRSGQEMGGPGSEDGIVRTSARIQPSEILPFLRERFYLGENKIKHAWCRDKCRLRDNSRHIHTPSEYQGQ